MKVRFAVGPDRGWLSGSALVDYAGAIETAGFDGVWLSDLPVAPALDPLLGVALLAGRTTAFAWAPTSSRSGAIRRARQAACPARPAIA